MISASGMWRKRSPATAASDSPKGARRSERIEGPHAPGDRQIDAHDDDRNHGESSGKRDVSGRALMGIDGLADEEARLADDAGCDVVAERQREGEDRAGDDAGERQRE